MGSFFHKWSVWNPVDSQAVMRVFASWNHCLPGWGETLNASDVSAAPPCLSWGTCGDYTRRQIDNKNVLFISIASSGSAGGVLSGERKERKTHRKRRRLNPLLQPRTPSFLHFWNSFLSETSQKMPTSFFLKDFFHADQLCSLYWVHYNIVSVLGLGFFCLFCFGSKACGTLDPQPGMEPAPSALEGEVLTTGPPGEDPPISQFTNHLLGKGLPCFIGHSGTQLPWRQFWIRRTVTAWIGGVSFRRKSTLVWAEEVKWKSLSPVGLFSLI